MNLILGIDMEPVYVAVIKLLTNIKIRVGF